MVIHSDLRWVFMAIFHGGLNPQNLGGFRGLQHHLPSLGGMDQQWDGTLITQIPYYSIFWDGN